MVVGWGYLGPLTLWFSLGNWPVNDAREKDNVSIIEGRGKTKTKSVSPSKYDGDGSRAVWDLQTTQSPLNNHLHRSSHYPTPSNPLSYAQYCCEHPVDLYHTPPSQIRYRDGHHAISHLNKKQPPLPITTNHTAHHGVKHRDARSHTLNKVVNIP